MTFETDSLNIATAASYGVYNSRHNVVSKELVATDELLTSINDSFFLSFTTAGLNLTITDSILDRCILKANTFFVGIFPTSPNFHRNEKRQALFYGLHVDDAIFILYRIFLRDTNAFTCFLAMNANVCVRGLIQACSDNVVIIRLLGLCFLFVVRDVLYLCMLISVTNVTTCTNICRKPTKSSNVKKGNFIVGIFKTKKLV